MFTFNLIWILSVIQPVALTIARGADLFSIASLKMIKYLTHFKWISSSRESYKNHLFVYYQNIVNYRTLTHHWLVEDKGSSPCYIKDKQMVLSVAF